MPSNPVELAQEKRDQVQAAESNGSKNATDRDKKPSRFKRFGEWARVNHDPVIAAFTIVLAVMALIQALIYCKQLDVIRKDQRPWIKITIPPNSEMSNSNPGIDASATLLNVGKTPAKEIDAHFFVEKVEARLQPTFNGKEIGAFTTGIIFPNAPEPVADRGVFFYPISPADMKQASEGSIFYVLYSTVKYEDSFGMSHWTHYCAFLAVFQQGSLPTVHKFNASKCTSYNETDNN